MKKIIPITCKGSSCVPLGDLLNFQGVLKSLDVANFEKLKTSILKHGFTFPVMVWGKKIIDGHQRTYVVNELINDGYSIDDIPTVEIFAKNEKEAAEKLLALNSHYAKMTDEGFMEFVDMFELDLSDMPELELPDVDLEAIMNPTIEAPGAGEEDKVPEVPDEPKTKPGDVYKLGNHRLMCGDSTSKEDVDALMDGQKADMVFTDPPYGVSYTGGHNQKKRDGIIADTLKGENLTGLFYDAIQQAISVTQEYSPFYIWYASGKSVETFASLSELPLTLRAVIQWYKVKSGLGAFMSQYIPNCEPCMYLFKTGQSPAWYGPTDEKTVWELKKEAVNEFHPTQKPIELSERAISNSSKTSDIILDLFLGSGSTLIASEKTGRKCFGMELDPKYCDVIVKRWEEYTGKKAELLNG